MVVIAGPTASGKSALALAVAAAIPSTIINADASQVYRDIPILSAAPSAEERARAPHRLFGTWDGAQACSAAEWAAHAKQVVVAAQGAGHVPILVGGTGLYLRTLLYGIAPVPDIAAEVREAVRALPVAQAYAALLQEDAQAAAKLHPHDTTRILRALEVVRSTGKPLHIWQTERVGGIAADYALHPLLLLPPRAWLYERIDTRFKAMLAAGALGEVEQLAARKLSPALPVMRAIGVRELADSLAGKSTLEAACAQAQLATRQYAKRQYTWFRHQFPAYWQRFDDILQNKQFSSIISSISKLLLT